MSEEKGEYKEGMRTKKTNNKVAQKKKAAQEAPKKKATQAALKKEAKNLDSAGYEMCAHNDNNMDING